MEEEKLVEHSREMGVYFLDQLKCLQRKHPLIADVRGRGLMIGLELSDELQSGRSTNIAFNMAMLCERKGLHITFSYFEPVIRFIPPLIVSAQEIDSTVGIIDDVLSSLQKGSENFSRFAPQNRRSGPFIEQMNNGLSLMKLWRRIYETSPKQWIRKLKTTL